MSTTPPVPGALAAIVRRRCPRCRVGPAFASWFRLRELCPACGHRFQRHPGSTVGVMQFGAMLIVLLAFASYFVLYGLVGLSMDAALVGMLVVSAVFGVVFHPYARLLWEAADVWMDRYEEGE